MCRLCWNLKIAVARERSPTQRRPVPFIENSRKCKPVHRTECIRGDWGRGTGSNDKETLGMTGRSVTLVLVIVFHGCLHRSKAIRLHFVQSGYYRYSPIRWKMRTTGGKAHHLLSSCVHCAVPREYSKPHGTDGSEVHSLCPGQWGLSGPDSTQEPSQPPCPLFTRAPHFPHVQTPTPTPEDRQGQTHR